jgi:endonuclease YncB( thermonuclease family)
MKRARTTLAALAVIGIVAATVTVVTVRRMDSGTRAREPPMAVESNATVVHVIDGDTVEARVQGRNEHVRLIGIDTSKCHESHLAT